MIAAREPVPAIGRARHATPVVSWRDPRGFTTWNVVPHSLPLLALRFVEDEGHANPHAIGSGGW